MQKTTPIVLNLIIINVLVYLAQRLVTPFDVTEWGALHYFKAPLFKPHQLITNMFLHSKTDEFHLIFNMFTLFIFGSTLENYLGSKRFLLFYLICGVGASILIQFTIPFSAGLLAKSKEGIEMAHRYGIEYQQLVDFSIQNYSALGASGAIMGVMVAFAYLFPNTEMMMMMVPVPIKAKYLIGGMIVVDLISGINRQQGDYVGHFAHLGGALVGFLLIMYWNKTNRKTFY